MNQNQQDEGGAGGDEEEERGDIEEETYLPRCFREDEETESNTANGFKAIRTDLNRFILSNPMFFLCLSERFSLENRLKRVENV